MRKLRSNCEPDWFSLVDHREDQFRNDLYTLLGFENIQKLNNQVKICDRNGKLLTDIDAVAFDKNHNTLAFFQLKWQDPFGFSMRERRSKMKNFINGSNQWIDTVAKWISETGIDSVVNRLDLDIDIDKHPNVKIEIIVLGRHHAKFTKGLQMSSKAAWGTWPQITRIACEEFRGGNMLKFLADKLRLEQVRENSFRSVPESGTIFKVGDITIEYLRG